MSNAKIDAAQRMNVSTDAKLLKSVLVLTISERVHMQLATEELLAILCGCLLTAATPIEYVNSSLFNYRFSSALENFYGYTENSVAMQVKRFYSERYGDEIRGTEPFRSRNSSSRTCRNLRKQSI